MRRKAGKGGKKVQLSPFACLPVGEGRKCLQGKEKGGGGVGPPLFIALHRKAVLLKDVLPFSFCSRGKNFVFGFLWGRTCAR